MTEVPVTGRDREERLPTGTVTFVFADIEGSTRMVQKLGDAFAPLQSEYHAIVSRAVREGGGVNVSTEGDGMFAVFPHCGDAIAAVNRAQRELAEHDWPGGEKIRARIGLHTGRAQLSDGDYVGLDVHRASRIADAGHGGQVVLSDATRALVEHALPEGVSIRGLGDHHLKDLDQPERLHQLVLDGLPSEFPSLRTLDARPTNLPAGLTTFVGREQEIRRVAELLAETRCVTLTGPGGTGKSRLALEVGRRMLADVADGVFLVALAPITDPALLPSTIAHAIGVQESADRSIVDGLKDHVRHRDMLLLLDNVEQIVDAAPVVTELLEVAPRLRVLATSRIPLRLSGEFQFRVAPLRVPDGRDLPPVEEVATYDAIALFIQRARAARSDFQLTRHNAATLVEICARLDGLPLAIELAAARVGVLPPDSMLERLGKRLDLLRGGPRDVPDRQRTLRGAIAWSHDLLGPDERAIFRRLAVFVGGWTLEAAEVVVDPDDTLETSVIEGLASLVDKSLVRQDAADQDRPRFAMLETIREFAGERLDESGERGELCRRHARHFRDVALQAREHLTSSPAWLDQVDREHDNFRAALRSAIDDNDVETALEIGASIWRFWHQRGHFSEGRDWLSQALSLGGADQPSSARAAALAAAAGLAYWQQDYEVAERLYRDSLELYQQLGDGDGEAEIRYSLAYVVAVAGDVEGALALFGRSGEIWRELGNRSGEANALQGVGMMAIRAGRTEEAISAADGARAMFRETGERFGLGNSTHLLAMAQRDAGDLDRAYSLSLEALNVFREDENRVGVAMAIGGAASIAAADGRAELAVRLGAASAAMEDRLGGGPPVALRGYEDPRTLVAQALPADAVERAWSAGLQLSEDAAVAEAVGEGSRPEAAGRHGRRCHREPA